MDIKIKKNWNDVTLGEYVQLESVTKTPHDDILDRGVAMVSALYDIDALQLPLSAFTALSSSMKFIGDRIPKKKVKSVYKLNGNDYELRADYTAFTTAQYVDYTNYQKQGDYIGMLSVVLIPKGHAYCDGYDLDKAKADIEDINVTQAMGIMDFFLKASATFTQHIIHYLRRKMKRTLRKDKEKAMIIDKNMKALEQTIGGFWHTF